MIGTRLLPTLRVRRVKFGWRSLSPDPFELFTAPSQSLLRASPRAHRIGSLAWLTTVRGSLGEVTNRQPLPHRPRPNRRPGHSCLVTTPDSCQLRNLGQVLSRPSSRLRSPGKLTGVVILRSQTDFTGPAQAGQSRPRDQDNPTCTCEPAVCQAARIRPLRHPPGVGAAVAAAPGGAEACAVVAARAARRAALKTYRSSHTAPGKARGKAV